MPGNSHFGEIFLRLIVEMAFRKPLIWSLLDSLCLIDLSCEYCDRLHERDYEEKTTSPADIPWTDFCRVWAERRESCAAFDGNSGIIL